MIYLIYGEEEYLIEHNINKILKKYSDYNQIFYDLDEEVINTVIDEANTIGLFGNKLIICKNCKFLSRQSSSIEQDTNILLEYLDNINQDAILILTNVSIDNTKKIVKKLKEKAEIIKCDKLDNLSLSNMVVKKFTKEGYKIEKDAVDKIIEMTLSDMTNLNSEINKLLMYKLDEKIITLNDVINIVSEQVVDNIFELIDCVVENNKNKIFEIYNKLINELNYEPTKILIMIANQFRLIMQTKIMTNNKMSESDIAKKLEVHPYRVKLANKKANKISLDKLKKYMLDLSTIDYEIKSGSANKNASLELFFINL